MLRVCVNPSFCSDWPDWPAIWGQPSWQFPRRPAAPGRPWPPATLLGVQRDAQPFDCLVGCCVVEAHFPAIVAWMLRSRSSSSASASDAAHTRFFLRPVISWMYPTSGELVAGPVCHPPAFQPARATVSFVPARLPSLNRRLSSGPPGTTTSTIASISMILPEAEGVTSRTRYPVPSQSVIKSPIRTSESGR